MHVWQQAEATAHGELRVSVAGPLVPAPELLGSGVFAQQPTVQAGRVISLASSSLDQQQAAAVDTWANWDGHWPRDGSTVLTASRILYNRYTPATSTVTVGDGTSVGDVTSDVQHLFMASDQLPTAVVTDVHVNANASVVYSGGIVVQPIANTGGIAVSSDAMATWASFAQVQQRLAELQLHSTHANGITLQQLATQLLSAHATTSLDHSQLSITASPIDLFCRCSKQAFVNNLVQSGGTALVDDLLREHAMTQAAASRRENRHSARDPEQTSYPDSATIMLPAEPGASSTQPTALPVADVVTTLSCGACNRRHYITASDLLKTPTHAR